MTNKLPARFFISGTDTMVGKTVVSAILTLGTGATYWKPVQSGLQPCSDSEFVRKACELPDWRVLPEVHRLERPLSPHLSARMEGKRIDPTEIHVPVGVDRLIVEGAGGLLVPLNETDLMIDLISGLQLPVLLVARSTLGTINHTMLSVEALRARGIPLIGVVMNGTPDAENRLAIEHYAKVKVLAQVPPLNGLSRKTLERAYNEYFTDLLLEEPVSNWNDTTVHLEGERLLVGGPR